MPSAPEVEIKFHIADLAALTELVKRSGFRLVTERTHEFNTLYDFNDRRLRQRGELIRLRKYGETWKITHKAKADPGRHKSRVETETNVGHGDAIAEILKSLGLEPSFRYEKYRTEWSDGTGHVVLDETPIGNIGEIEGPPEWIDATAEKLGIPHSAYITDSYAQLFFDWKKRMKSPAEEMTFAAVGRKS